VKSFNELQKVMKKKKLNLLDEIGDLSADSV